MVSRMIVSLIAATLILVLGAGAAFLFVTQAFQGHALYRQPVTPSLSKTNEKAEGTVPEAALPLYAQLSSMQNTKTGGPADAREVTLHKSLGQVYQDSGNYAEAIKHFSLAREQAAQLGDSESIVMIQTILGNMYTGVGRLQDAKRELESAFLLMDRSGPNAFATMRALANARRDSGKLDEALALYGETLRLQNRETDNMNKVFPMESVAGLLSDMGVAYLRKGQMDVAMSHFQQALDKVTTSGKGLPTSGTVAVELAEIYNNIGQVNHERGNLEQAHEYYRKALRLQQHALRVNHPCIVETMIHLARLQRDSGASEDSALAALSKAEALLKGRENHREFSRVLMLKADLLRKAHRMIDAEAAAVRAIEIQEDLGSETPELAIILNIYGMILHDNHKYEDAVKHFMRALMMNMKTVGKDHPETALTYNNLGYLYQDVGDNAAAEKYYRKSVEIQKTIYTNDPPDVAATYNNIATIMVGQGRLSEAKELLTKVVDIVRIAGMPPSSPERAVYEQNLEDVQHRLAGSIQGDKVQMV